MRYSYGVPVNSARRAMASVGCVATLLCAGGLLALPAPTTLVAACPPGETKDVNTEVCMPTPATNVIQETTAPGGLPEVDGVPCTGGNSYECIGLAEEQEAAGPTPVPTATFGTPATAPAPDPVVGATPAPAPIAAD
jgi:hypothetical protein